MSSVEILLLVIVVVLIVSVLAIIAHLDDLQRHILKKAQLDHDEVKRDMKEMDRKWLQNKQAIDSLGSITSQALRQIEMKMHAEKHNGK